MSKWVKYFLGICDAVSVKSKDPSTKVGAVIVGPSREIRTTGYNGFPRCVEDTHARLNDRPTKYQLTVHAEMNAILAAAKNGVSLEECVLYTHWHPCHECAKAIIQCGIRKVFVSGSFMKKRGVTGWEDSFKVAKEMFDEAGVNLMIFDEETNGFVYKIEDSTTVSSSIVSCEGQTSHTLIDNSATPTQVITVPAPGVMFIRKEME